MPGHFTFYSNIISGDVALFDETEFKHAIQVLRYQLGDVISFSDGIGGLYEASVNSIGKREFSAKILSRKAVEPLPTIIMGMGILKSSDRMEWALEKCTELGVTKFWFLKTKNSERSHLNLDRLTKVAISAMKQSHSAYLPELKLLNFEEALRNSEELSIGKYIGYCGEADKQPIRSCIVPSVFLIGPEGDFSEHEYTLAATNGFLGIEMGKSILRTETAAVAAISALRLK
ncbi:MAG: RsmE family RNA methyltransferase [Bacteroidota bacterium]|jgi:16S rRNA (uracil1498-N3)-methyltransferase